MCEWTARYCKSENVCEMSERHKTDWRTVKKKDNLQWWTRAGEELPLNMGILQFTEWCCLFALLPVFMLDLTNHLLIMALYLTCSVRAYFMFISQCTSVELFQMVEWLSKQDRHCICHSRYSKQIYVVVNDCSHLSPLLGNPLQLCSVAVDDIVCDNTTNCTYLHVCVCETWSQPEGHAWIIMKYTTKSSINTYQYISLYIETKWLLALVLTNQTAVWLAFSMSPLAFVLSKGCISISC